MSTATSVVTERKQDCECGEKFCVNTEGTFHEWPVATITTEQIADLGCWDFAAGVIEIDEDNNERTLRPGEIVKLEPGRSFCKKLRWKRG
jgi:hypothetical protein